MHDPDLSEHFTLEEFCVSQVVSRRGWYWPEMPDKVYDNLVFLARSIGEPLREACGNRPVVVQSGWRFPRLNKAVRGAKHSAHLDGRAMDITVPGLTPREVARHAATLFEADKVILEFNAWVHVQIPRPHEKPRQQCLCAYSRQTWGGARTHYAEGFDAPQGLWT